MRRDQLEHAFRTACQIIHQSEVIVVGSQAILGTDDDSQLPRPLAEQPESRREPATYLAGRRLADIAYGASLWWGTAKARSVRVLLPRRPGRV